MGKKTVIAIIGDTHVGSTVGLCPPGQWQHEDGYHRPGPFQKLLWKEWSEYWAKVRAARENARLIVVHNGDAVDGNHHRTTQIWTPMPGEQERAHIECMDWALNEVGFDEEAGDQLYYTSPTKAHGGEGNQSDERIARDLGAVFRKKPKRKGGKDGSALFPHLSLSLHGGSVRIDIKHHGPGPGTRLWTKGNALRSILKNIYIEALERSEKIPKKWFYVWSHNHRYLPPERVHTNNGTLEGTLMPAFQGITHYIGTKQPGDMVADIGAFYFVVDDDYCDLKVHRKVINLTQAERIKL
jgi:hypothetical protein